MLRSTAVLGGFLFRVEAGDGKRTKAKWLLDLGALTDEELQVIIKIIESHPIL